jgi:hypothetical protein
MVVVEDPHNESISTHDEDSILVDFSEPVASTPRASISVLPKLDEELHHQQMQQQHQQHQQQMYTQQLLQEIERLRNELDRLRMNVCVLT